MSALKTVLFVLTAAGLCACAHGRLKRAGPETVAVVAEGWAPVAGGDVLGTAKRALAEAQRQAVERVVGVALRARTRVDQAVSVDQRIWADAAGRIASYEILDEREEEGFHKTRIRAFVFKAPPRPPDGRPEPLPGDLKVAVVVDTRAFPDGKAAERGLRQGLGAAGVPVGFGRADYLVSGDAEVAPLDSSALEGFFSYRARLSFELRDPARDEVISARSVTASGMDLSGRLAAAQALENAGRLAGAAVAADLRAALRDR